MWGSKIRKVLFSSGFGDVWLNQGVGQAEVFLKVFKQKMLDIDSLNLNSDIHDIDQLRPYKRFSKKKKKINK